MKPALRFQFHILQGQKWKIQAYFSLGFLVFSLFLNKVLYMYVYVTFNCEEPEDTKISIKKKRKSKALVAKLVN